MTGQGIDVHSSEASSGGYQAIIEVEGVLQPVNRIPNKFTSEDDDPEKPRKDQAEITLEDAVILEMEPGEPAPPLKEGVFTTYINFALPGKEKPHKRSLFVRGFLSSAEALDAERRKAKVEEGNLRNLYGTRILLKKEMIHLFTRKDKVTDEEESIDYPGFVVKEAEAGSSEDIKDYVKGVVVGLNESAARRIFITDDRIKRFPEYKDALVNGTLGELIPVKLEDDKFIEVEDEASVS